MFFLVLRTYLDFRTANQPMNSSKEQFSQSLTGASVDGPTAQVEITKFDEAETETTTLPDVRPQLQLNAISNPYPDQTPRNVLCRNYRVATYNWTATSVPVTLTFPDLLLNVATIGTYLEPFKYIRSGIKIEMRINATQFHYGALMITYEPNRQTAVHSTGMYQRSGLRPLIMSPSVQNAITFEIPYVIPYNYIPINPLASFLNIAKVDITPLTPLCFASPNIPDTVEVQIFAAFVNPEVASYIVPTWTETQTNMFGETAKKGVIRAPSKIQAKAQSGNYRNKHKKEANEKSEKGIMDTVVSATSTVNSILEQIPIVGGMIENLFGVIGLLDKPTSTMVKQPMGYDFSGDMAMGDGLDVSNRLGAQVNTPVSISPSLMGDDDQFQQISNIIQTPMLRAVIRFDGTTVPSFNFRVGVIDDTEATSGTDYVQFIAGFFHYWRGSFKYLFHFYCSTFTTARFRISVLFTAATVEDANSGDIVSRVVDVKGDTQVSMTVPYLWHTMYRVYNDEVAYPKILIQNISPIIGPSIESDAIVWCTVWRAAGEDFQFNQLTDWKRFSDGLGKKPTKKLKAKAQLDVCATFKKTFDPILEGSKFGIEQGVVSGEKITTIKDMIRRYCNSYVELPTINDTFPDYSFTGQFHKMSSIFRYWRGSRRVRIKFKGDDALFTNDIVEVFMYDNAVASTASFNNGGVFTVPSLWPVVAIEIPWYSTLPFQDVQLLLYPVGDWAMTFTLSQEPTADSYKTWISAGDDFTYGWLVSPTA